MSQYRLASPTRLLARVNGCAILVVQAFPLSSIAGAQLSWLCEIRFDRMAMVKQEMALPTPNHCIVFGMAMLLVVEVSATLGVRRC